MIEESVFALARIACSLSDADLERDWNWRSYREGVRYAFLRTYEELRQLAAELAAQRSCAGPQVTPAQRALAQYQAAYRDWQAVWLGVKTEWFDRAPAEGEWPLRKVYGHVVAVEREFYARIHFAVDQFDQALFPSVMPDAVIEELLEPYADFERLQAGESLERLSIYHDELRLRVVNEFCTLGEKELQCGSLWWEGAPYPVQFRLHRFDAHLRQHIVQVEKTLHCIGGGPQEIHRLLRLIYAALAEAEGALIGAWHLAPERLAAAERVITARSEELEKRLASGS